MDHLALIRLRRFLGLTARLDGAGSRSALGFRFGQSGDERAFAAHDVLERLDGDVGEQALLEGAGGLGEVSAALAQKYSKGKAQRDVVEGKVADGSLRG